MKNEQNNRKNSKGYIALMATIIISLMLLVMAVKQSTSGWSARFNILGTEAKEQASALAEGCAEQAQASILTNPNYTGDIDITTEAGTCHIFPVKINYLNDIPTNGYVTIKTQAVVRGSYANLNMAMKMNDIHLGGIPSAPTTGTVFVTVHVINDSGSGTKLASDFAMKLTSTVSTNFQGSENGEIVTVQAGQAYSISESPSDPNYSKSATTDCVGAGMVAGDVKYCTITYDDITTTLTLIANVVNDSGTGTKTPSDFPLFIDGNPVTLGQRVTVNVNNHSASTTLLAGYFMSPWGYDCTDDTSNVTPGYANITALGQNKTCVINFDDIPPPAPSCADTVMMLDRSGSMFPAYGGGVNDIPNEKTAAKSLVALYAGVLPPALPPQIGIGRFGDIATGLSAEIISQLTVLYANLPTLIDNGLPQNPVSFTNLADAITVGSAELNSARHIAGKQKVIILVSDGDPNRPSGTTAYDTTFKSPTANAQNAAGELWNTPTSAYDDAGTDASDPVSENDKHQFYNFGFGGGAGLPAGVNVTGIEAKVDAWATAPGSVSTSPSLTPSALGTYDQFTSNSGTDVSAVSSNNGDTTYIDNSVSVETFAVGNASTIPPGSTINSVTITAVAKGSPANAVMQIVAEKGGTLSVGPNITVTSGSYNTYTRVMDTDPTGANWTLAEVNNWTTKFGVRTTNSANVPRVTQMYVVVNYSPGTDSGLKIPTTIHTPNNWSPNTVANAQTSNNGYIQTNNNSQQGYSFGASGLSIPGTATITGVEVISEAKSSDSSGCEIGAELSSNGSIFTTTGNTDSLGGSDATTNIGGAGNMWGRAWTPADFNNANFTVRIAGVDPGSSCTNNSTTFVDLLQVKVYYTNGSIDSPSLTPSALGTYDQFTSNSGTDVSAVSSNNGDTTYIDNSVSVETFAVGNASTIPPGSTINSVTITAVAKGSPANAVMQIVAEKGGTLSVGPNITVTSGSYNTYTRVMDTDPTGANWTLAEVNNWTTKFGVRTTNSANVPRVTQMYVVVNYNTTGAVACQLGMELSWNDGGSWTTPEKTQTLTGTVATYTLGASNDDWTSTHTWAPTEFSNTNFRARVHAIDPGAGCDNAAVDHLDWLQLKVHYTQNVDSVQAALNAADAAKLDGIDIFTIHFGSDSADYPGKELLANLASGPNTPPNPVTYNGSSHSNIHQNGSLSDGAGGTMVDAGPLQPTATIAPNQFTNPTRAYTSDNSYATDAVNGHQQGYTNFNLNIPPAATINGIGVEIEAKSSDSSGCQVGVELSSDSGLTFTMTNTLVGVTGSDNTYNLGGNASLWGRAWNNTNFSNGSFVVRLQNIDPGNNCTNGSTLSVDRVRVHVYNTSANTENSDGDNFFVAPTSADMKGIFDFIGNQVCPAALNLAATPPPTTAQLTILTQVTNNNTVNPGTKTPSDFHVNGNSNGSPITPFAGSATGVTITVNPGTYDIYEDNADLDGYTPNYSATCSSVSPSTNIVAGENRMCFLNNDDIPPPPPPPNLNFDTNTWHEVPTN